MKYVGLQTQQRQNNFKSSLLIILFPCIILLLVWIFFHALEYFVVSDDDYAYSATAGNQMFLEAVPYVIIGCGVWFFIAYFANTAIINMATGAHTLERRDNKRVYNLVENLCIANNLSMPKLNILEDDSLNAYASGINKKTYTVTLSRGIIDRLNDDELEGVIAHELTHIRNRDVRLLIISIVFVGIFSFLTQFLLRSMFYSSVSSRSNSKDNKGGGIIVMIIAIALAIIGYSIAILMRFAISRQREYMADAGGAEMTKNPRALASALRKISGDSRIEEVTQRDVAQLFISNPLSSNLNKKSGGFSSLFATHPPIEKRIAVLEQF